MQAIASSSALIMAVTISTDYLIGTSWGEKVADVSYQSMAEVNLYIG